MIRRCHRVMGDPAVLLAPNNASQGDSSMGAALAGGKSHGSVLRYQGQTATAPEAVVDQAVNVFMLLK